MGNDGPNLRGTHAVANLWHDGKLSVSIPVIFALHIAQLKPSCFDGSGAEQDGELDDAVGFPRFEFEK